MTDTPDDLVKCVFWLAIDEDGDYVVTIDGANLDDEAGHLMPGYRTIEVTVRARPPTDARVEVTAPDAPVGEATASIGHE
jgi:hypothetical protein